MVYSVYIGIIFRYSPDPKPKNGNCPSFPTSKFKFAILSPTGRGGRAED